MWTIREIVSNSMRFRVCLHNTAGLRLSFRYEFIPVPSCDSVFVFMIPSKCHNGASALRFSYLIQPDRNCCNLGLLQEQTLKRNESVARIAVVVKT